MVAPKGGGFWDHFWGSPDLFGVFWVTLGHFGSLWGSYDHFGVTLGFSSFISRPQQYFICEFLNFIQCCRVLELVDFLFVGLIFVAAKACIFP